MLTYGISTYCIYEYLNIGESTRIECLKNFTVGVIHVFAEEYLRGLTQAIVDHLLQVARVRDFLVY